MAKLEPLKAIASLSLLANDIENGVNQLSALSVVSLCPIVPCTGLAEHKVIRTEELAKRSSTHRIH